MSVELIFFKSSRGRGLSQCAVRIVIFGDHETAQFSSVQSLDQLGRRRDLMDDSAEILFQSFLQEALVSSSGMGRDVQALMLSIQHFLCRPQRRPPYTVS